MCPPQSPPQQGERIESPAEQFTLRLALGAFLVAGIILLALSIWEMIRGDWPVILPLAAFGLVALFLAGPLMALLGKSSS